MTLQRTLSRRTVLKGIGTAIGLPWLEAMMPRSTRAAVRSADAHPVRSIFLYVPNGMHMPDWHPDKVGDDFTVPPILQPIADYRSEMTMLSGLTLNGARALGDGGGDHARSVAAYLTGAHPKKTSGSDIQNGQSVDQLAAAKIGHKTRLTSLELGTEASAPAGRCDSGYSCVYTSNMCWRTPTSPVAKEIDPAAVFDRLFQGRDRRLAGQAKSKRQRYQKSVLDFVLEDAQDLQHQLGQSDRRKLDEYLYAVRDIERRIHRSEKIEVSEEGVPDYPRPAGVPRQYEEHIKIMFDLMALALQTDSTRIITFMYANAGSNRSYRNLKVPEGHHDLSHHGNNAKRQAKISKINTYHASLFRHLLDRLKSVQEGEGTLLDQCMVMYGSGIGDGNRHNHHDLPIVLLGQGGGTIKTGRHLKFPRETPLTNLYLSMLDRMDVHVDQFGDSTGRLDNLAG